VGLGFGFLVVVVFLTSAFPLFAFVAPPFVLPLFFESSFIFLHLFGQLFLVASNLQSSIFLSLHDAGSVGVTSGVGVTFTLEKKETVIRTLID